MACRSCHLETETVLCNVCRFLKEELHRSAPRVNENCGHCAAPIGCPEPAKKLCFLCGGLLEVVSGSGWLLRAHAEWEEENAELARRKQRLLGRRGMTP